MRYYPAFLDLRGRRALVVGGGKVAERKVRKLLRAGASVRVISPDLTSGLTRLAAEKKITVTRRRYRKGVLSVRGIQGSPLLVFAATDDPKTQRKVAEETRAAGALVNVASDAAECDFIVPASFTRGDLHVAVSTSGRNPALARMVRQRLVTVVRKIKRKKLRGKRKK